MKALILFLLLSFCLAQAKPKQSVTITGTVQVFETDFKRNPTKLVIPYIDDTHYEYYFVNDKNSELFNYIGKKVTVTAENTKIKIIDTTKFSIDTIPVYGKKKVYYDTNSKIDTFYRNILSNCEIKR
jgi:hypothetical protein